MEHCYWTRASEGGDEARGVSILRSPIVIFLGL